MNTLNQSERAVTFDTTRTNEIQNQINYRIYESHYISTVNRNARPIHHIVKALKESLFHHPECFAT